MQNSNGTKKLYRTCTGSKTCTGVENARFFPPGSYIFASLLRLFNLFGSAKIVGPLLHFSYFSSNFVGPASAPNGLQVFPVVRRIKTHSENRPMDLPNPFQIQPQIGPSNKFINLSPNFTIGDNCSDKAMS